MSTSRASGSATRRTASWPRRYGRPVAALAIVLGAVTAVLVALGTGVGAAPDGPGTTAVTPRYLPCAKPAPTSAAGYQRMFDRLYGSWAGGDQALSVRLPDGRTLWVFADTIGGTRAADGGYAPGWSMRHNSFVIQDRGCLTATGGADAIPAIGPDDWYWPNSAVVHAGRLYVFAMRVHRTGTDTMSFAVTGTSLAVFSLPRLGDPALLTTRALPRQAPGATPTLWGAGVVVARGTAYIYGTHAVDQRTAWGRELYVARVPVNRLTDTTAWRYFDGAAFTAAAGGARAVVPAAGGVSTSVSVLVDRSGGTAVISKQNEVFGPHVRAWTAPTPFGPFTAQTRSLVDAPSLQRPGELRYTAEAHPDLPLAGGGLLLSVCRNNLQLQAVAADTLLYRPQFYAVTPPR